MYKKVLSAAVLAVAVVAVSKPVFAQQQVVIDEGNKVAICHRDNNVKKPYGPKKIEVNQNSVDGEGQNDHTHHTGPIATSEAVAQELKDDGTKWGDIIPPVAGNPDGLNWTTEGQAIWNNDCQFVTPPVVPEVPVVPPTTDTTGTVLGAATAAPQVAAVPVKGVSAGAGGSASSVAPAVAAMTGSLLALAYGAVRVRKFNA